MKEEYRRHFTYIFLKFHQITSALEDKRANNNNSSETH